MTQKNTNTKMVSFRLSSSEYEAALTACRAHGFRSMSLLARSAFLAYSPQASRPEPQESELNEIRQRLEFLTNELNRLSALMAADGQAAQEEASYAQVAR